MVVEPVVEPAHDLLRTRLGPLDVFVRPRNVALIGATEAPGSVGRTLLSNLLGNAFGGRVFPINPKREAVLGQRAYPRLADLPAAIDLAVIATPAATVPGLIDECLAAKVAGAIIISAGFKEIGPAGVVLETEIQKRLVGSKLRVLGPNCLGVISPLSGLNATFASSTVRPGRVGFISQSGALLTAILDWAIDENVGFSHVVSTGSMLDVGWGDLIDFLGDDPQTSSILIYMESIGNAKRFFSAAREVSLQKPIVVIKAGRSEAAAKAAASHTGALTGGDEALEALFRRAGVLRVRQISELFHMAEVLAKQPRPKGPRLAIVTNAGGPAVLATDTLIECGGQLAELSAGTIDALSAVLPAHWSHANPVDVLGDASPERFAKGVEIVTADPQCDGVLAILAPQAIADPAVTAERLNAVRRPHDKPLLASWMGGIQVVAGMRLLNQASIPTFSYPDSAARTFYYMWLHSYLLKGLYETPTLAGHDDQDGDGVREVAKLIRQTVAAGRTLLTEVESKALLSAYDIPVVETFIATSPDEAVAHARRIGYPVVLKLYSRTIGHKTDVGGVKLNLTGDEAVRRAFAEIATAVERRAGAGSFAGVSVQPMISGDGYELIVGSSIDPQLGPVLLFGSGGQLVEVYQDRSLGLPPLTSTLARRMMERTRIYRALSGVRGRRPADLAALEELLVRFSQLVIEHPRIREIDINPLLAGPDRIVALDARVVLHPPGIADAELPRSVIRPYPRQYVSHWTARDGRRLSIRPIRPEDEALVAQFHTTLSDQTVYSRFSQVLTLSQRTLHERLARVCFVDYDRQMALVAIDEQDPDSPRIAGIARLIKLHSSNAAEFSILISDAYQRCGLGTQLMSRLVEVGRAERLERIVGDIRIDNRAMLSLCRRLGFTVADTAPDTMRHVAIAIVNGATET
jgi:acetyltransferase